jgi:hypothetical protein
MEQQMNIEKFRGIAYFENGRTEKSVWFYTDIHAKQWAQQFLDTPGYESYDVESRVFWEKVDLNDRQPIPHPLKGGF